MCLLVPVGAKPRSRKSTPIEINLQSVYRSKAGKCLVTGTLLQIHFDAGSRTHAKCDGSDTTLVTTSKSQ